jgi:hypothetical protein
MVDKVDKAEERYEAVRYSLRGHLYVDPNNPHTIPGSVLACGTLWECRAAIVTEVIEQFFLDAYKTEDDAYKVWAWTLLRSLRWTPSEADRQEKNILECFRGDVVYAKRGGWLIRPAAK